MNSWLERWIGRAWDWIAYESLFGRTMHHIGETVLRLLRVDQ